MQTFTTTTEIGCVLHDPAKASHNVRCVNDWFGQMKDCGPPPWPPSELVVDAGRLYVDAELVRPPKTNIKLRGVGSGLSYRVGDYNYGWPGQGATESVIVNINPGSECIIRDQGVGAEICHLKLQGNVIPKDDHSGDDSAKVRYAIINEGRTYPSTGKAHYHDLSIINCWYGFGFPPQPEAMHADTMSYGKLILQGCLGIAHFNNLQSIGHYFTGLIEFLGDGRNAGHVGFDIVRGGDIHAPYIHWNTGGGTVAKFHGGSFSPNTNNFEFGVRVEYDGVNMTDFSFVDLTDPLNNDYPFHIRLKGSIAGFGGVHYDPARLVRFMPNRKWQYQDIAQDVQIQYAGATAIERNRSRSMHAMFNGFRYPRTMYMYPE